MRFFLFFLAFQLTAATDALYLSWYGNPATTMTIQWHAPASEALDLCELKAPSGETFIFQATSQPFPSTGLTVYTIRLKNLEPDTLYEFQIGEEHYSFRTAPLSLEKPIQFVIGGDLYTKPETFRALAKQAAAKDPLFAVLGGDIAYALSHNFFRSSASRQWHRFLADWKDTMVAPGNRLIPFLIVPGNHDVSEDHFDLFFTLFAFPEHRLYRAIDFGSYLSLILLDTGYLAPIEGTQAKWLKSALEERRTVPYLIPVYHEDAYPSYYSPEAPKSRSIRAHWCPLFDAYHLPAAFEHHSHTYKITYPIRADKHDTSGTTYFGDGCWGVTPRQPHTAWYLKTTAPKNHFYLVTLTLSQGTIEAIGLENQSLSSSPLPLRRTK